MYMESRFAWRRMWFFLGLTLLAALPMTTWPRWSVAQVATPEEKAATPEENQAAEKAAPAGEKAPAEAGRSPAATVKPQRSFLSWILYCSGLIGLVILCLSVYFVSTVGRLFWEMRLETAAPPEMVMQCESLLEQRDFKGIYNLVREDDSFFSRALTTGISELPSGLAEAREAMERVGEAITAEMEKKISMLAVLGTLGPMIGLLGTLKGMIASFQVIGRAEQGILNPTDVANCISEALVLTFEGVALSVPAIYFFALFRNRVIYIATSVMLSADQFLRHFSHAGRAKASAAAPAAAPAVPAKAVK